MFVWLKFLICGASLLYVGYRLSYYGDVISEKTNLSTCQNTLRTTRQNWLSSFVYHLIVRFNSESKVIIAQIWEASGIDRACLVV